MPRCVEQLLQVEGCAAGVGRGDVGHQRVPGAPRMPLPMRSTKHAPMSTFAEAATAKNGLLAVPSA